MKNHKLKIKLLFILIFQICWLWGYSQELTVDTTFWDNGNIKEIKFLKNGEKIGKYQKYYENGNMMEEGQFGYGKIKDIVIDSSNTIFSDECIEQLKEAVEIAHLTNDSVIIEVGKWKYYFENNKIQMIGYFFPEYNITYSCQYDEEYDTYYVLEGISIDRDSCWTEFYQTGEVKDTICY